ncbi:MAG TPA: alpha amylase C-terminal domain-containing protein [Bacteroidales bacterium]|nr:alpha amylase C-terminal domain-containing protein [Bacteroidota bacterium]HNY58108.1 alpha amylase C-terminal domain-containing protein [Bacteroidales bacterium]HOE24025.1 alpha amylase C-terminal domain-containing protein [Bacteroidales bacterium]HOH14227.1 alpha amylase C-terminal domain-containing protein [Bacteroidales bacterium]HPA69279.1 alpha amylase C-terminal domain-containing protein [Bacteroidales bacterium]
MTERFYKADPWLDPFREIIEARLAYISYREKLFTGGRSMTDYANGHHWYGLHRTPEGWVFREHAPNATSIILTGTFSEWKEDGRYALSRTAEGDWVGEFDAGMLSHGDLYKMIVKWKGGQGERIPAYATRAVQDEVTKIFSAQVWNPENEYVMQHKAPPPPPSLLVYEAHVGMATEEERTGTYREFTRHVLPRVKSLGYNTVQLMAIQEHPYYGSFGYHVSSLFAPSSRFGTPDDLRELIDTAHSMGLRVTMDLVHSHAVANILEGLGLLDGDPGLYFHTGSRRKHVAWDSLCYDYGKPEVNHFLLSNCKYWLEEFHFDGFRFDGITSMLYYDHGLESDFVSYKQYFDGNQDKDAIVYITLANKLIHEFNQDATTVAEDMSGMPGLAASVASGGMGFDYRLAMGVPDIWIKMVKDIPDEEWDLGYLLHELTQHRTEEKVISYCESHDQALVGDKTLIFRLADKEMYTSMSVFTPSLIVDRAMALHKMIRLFTFMTAGGGYLTFMGNEFGHPEWIDFPREGNGWSYKYARRQWSLADDELLKYRFLNEFDRAMIETGKRHGLPRLQLTESLLVNNADKIIAFRRGDLVTVMNFNPTISFTGYGIPVRGKFRIILDTDDPMFGGQGRIDTNQTYFAQPDKGRYGVTAMHHLRLYLPARTAVVLLQERVKTIMDL